jgi:hypothetical protein
MGNSRPDRCVHCHENACMAFTEGKGKAARPFRCKGYGECPKGRKPRKPEPKG